MKLRSNFWQAVGCVGITVVVALSLSCSRRKEITQDDLIRRALNYYRDGLKAEQAGQLDAAQVYFDQSLAVTPRPLVQYHYAMLLIKVEKFDAAEAQLQDALAESPHFREAEQALDQVQAKRELAAMGKKPNFASVEALAAVPASATATEATPAAAPAIPPPTAPAMPPPTAAPVAVAVAEATAASTPTDAPTALPTAPEPTATAPAVEPTETPVAPVYAATPVPGKKKHWWSLGGAPQPEQVSTTAPAPATPEVKKKAPLPPEQQDLLKQSAVLAKAGKPQDAINLLREGTKRFPEAGDLYYNLGVLYYQQQDFARAELELRTAAQCEPDSSEVFNNLGVVQEELGKVTDAEGSYKRAIALDDMVDAHYNLAVLYDKRADLQAAINEYEAYLKKVPTGQYSDQAKRRLETLYRHR